MHERKGCFYEFLLAPYLLNIWLRWGVRTLERKSLLFQPPVPQKKSPISAEITGFVMSYKLAVTSQGMLEENLTASF